LYNGPFDGQHDKPIVPWSNHPKGKVPEGYYSLPLENASITKPGSDVTIITYGTMVHVCLEAAAIASVDAEIIDLRTLWPVDIETITDSVKKTGRCIIVHEATQTSGFGAELSALIQERCFYFLEVPVQRITGWDTPYPHAHEWSYFPGPKRIAASIKRAMKE